MLLQDDDELARACATLTESSHYAMLPYLVVGAVRPASSDTAAKAVERLNSCFDRICSDQFRMLQDKQMPQAWAATAKTALRTIDCMYAIYLESFINRVALTARAASVKRPGVASPIKQTPSTPTHRKTPTSRGSLNNTSLPKPESSRSRPTPSPIRSGNGAVKATSTTTQSTHSDSDSAHAQAKAQERVRIRQQGSLNTAAAVQKSEIAPGIVRTRQVAYGSPVKKGNGVNGKPAWR